MAVQLKAISEHDKHQSLVEQLTLREIDIINSLLVGRTAKEAGKLLAISHRTVEKHMEKIKEKLCCKTKLELMSKIFESHYRDGS